MNFQTLFEQYYRLYRGDSTAPASSDPEWTLAWSYYNDALNRMAGMDDTKWRFLWTTLQASTQVSPVLVRTLGNGVTTYAAPTNMAEPGGQITFIDTALNRLNYPVIQPYEAQAISSMTVAGWFTGDKQAGFTLNLKAAPSSTQVGYGLDYNYYRKPTYLTSTESGTSIIEGGDPSYYYNWMLAQRFRASRNWPAYQTAKHDAVEALNNMKIKNNSGNFYNNWTLLDTSGANWGVE